jgi:hypothetical protein
MQPLKFEVQKILGFNLDHKKAEMNQKVKNLHSIVQQMFIQWKAVKHLRNAKLF